MNHEPQNESSAPAVNRASGAAIGFIAVSVVFAALALLVKFAVKVPAMDADRDAVRAKALAEIHAAESRALDHAGWIDQQRGIVRLPIDVAMAEAAHDWQNPEKARADLIARAEKAAAPLPKNAPKTSAFE